MADSEPTLNERYSRMDSLRWAQNAAARLLKGRSTQCTWMRTFEFQTYLESYLRETGLSQYMRGKDAQAILSQGLITQWEEGDRYVLSTAATAATFSAAETLWGEVTPPILPDDMPAFTGLALLARTIYAKNSAGEKVGISAISWSPCYVGVRAPGILLATWTHKDAEGDETLAKVRNAWKTAHRLMDDEDEEIRLLRRALQGATETPKQERAHLQDLLAKRTRQARITRQQMSRPPLIPEYALLDLQPIPFGREYGTNGGLSHRTRRADATVSLDVVASDAPSMVMRLPYALWGLITQQRLTTFPAPLAPDVERKFSKKRLAHEIMAVDTSTILDAQDLVTVERVRAARSGPAAEWGDAFQWSIQDPICGRAMG